MADTFAVNLTQPITSVRILDDNWRGSNLTGEFPELAEKGSPVKISAATVGQEVEDQKAQLSQLCQTLGSLVEKLRQFYDEASAKYKEEIAKLSVEIARRVLMQKVQKGDYEIESIVKEVLKNAPTRQGVVVHLNPEDLGPCQKLQADAADGSLADIKFVADASMGRAECLLETPKGIVKSSLDEHLGQISEALKKLE